MNGPMLRQASLLDNCANGEGAAAWPRTGIAKKVAPMTIAKRRFMLSGHSGRVRLFQRESPFAAEGAADGGREMNFRLVTIVLPVLLVAGCAGNPSGSAAVPIHGVAQNRAASASLNGIAVSGNRLVDGSGNTVQLQGVNRSGTEYACVQGWGIFDGPNDATSARAIASWHVNIVRVLLNEDCWLGINGIAPQYSGQNYQ